VKYRLEDALAYAAVAATAAAIGLWLGMLCIGQFPTYPEGVRDLYHLGLLACCLSLVLVAVSGCRSLVRIATEVVSEE
jgi:hypothetical protein